MSNPITLPPLPEPVYTYDEDGNKVFYEKASLVRARDLEVARVVLEAAAKACREYPEPEAHAWAHRFAQYVSALEVRHHE